MLDTMLQGLVFALSCFGPPPLLILLLVLSFREEILVLEHSVLEEYNFSFSFFLNIYINAKAELSIFLKETLDLSF